MRTEWRSIKIEEIDLRKTNSISRNKKNQVMEMKNPLNKLNRILDTAEESIRKIKRQI